MKFISKAANLNIILRPGMQAQPLTGSPAIATIFVKFKDGIAEVEQEELIEMMLAHSGFNRDFVAADDKGTDPYAHVREQEVEYVTEELVHGQAKRVGTPVRKVLSPEIKKMISEQAMSIAKQMLPEMVKAVLQGAKKASVEEVETPKAPKRVKTTEVVKADVKGTEEVTGTKEKTKTEASK